jgi:dihydroorotate dehydrogenase electron transfer subunit
MNDQYKILRNENISQNYFKITLDISGSLTFPIPGQFYNIRCSDTNEPLLRRPFSFHRLIDEEKSGHMEILYRVIGKGTEWLSRRKKGESLDMIGPFGNGFFIEEDAESFLFVARGIGISPLYGLAEQIVRRKKEKKIFILMGARLKERIFYEKECEKIGEVFLYTDDGSEGFHGRAPDLLLHLLEKSSALPKRFSLYACGPSAMLKDLALLSERFGFHGQVALEGHMGCGFGACLSCACPLRPQHIIKNDYWKKPALQWSEDEKIAYSLICKDGPVYNLQEVDWDEWIT